MHAIIAETNGTIVVLVGLLIVAICAVIVVVAIRRYKVLNVRFDVPGFLRFFLSGSEKNTDAPTAGATATDIETGGKLEVDAKGGPAAAERVKAVGDVSVRSTAAGEGGDSKKA